MGTPHACGIGANDDCFTNTEIIETSSVSIRCAKHGNDFASLSDSQFVNVHSNLLFSRYFLFREAGSLH